MDLVAVEMIMDQTMMAMFAVSKHFRKTVDHVLYLYYFPYFLACYNCQQTGHMSRDCPNPRNENQNNNRSGFSSGSNGNRGGFHSGGGGNCKNYLTTSLYSSCMTMSFVVRGSQNSDGDNQHDNNGSKSAFQSGGFRGNARVVYE